MRTYDDWADAALLSFIKSVAGVLPLVIGLIVLISPPERFSAAAWVTLLEWSPPKIWGMGFVATGLMGIYQHRLVAFLGHAGTAAWMWVWTASFLVSAAKSPNSSTGLIPLIAASSLVYTAFAVATWMDRS